ncbi:hypothetical protein TNCV_1856311 [Trichonephila clavipes]|nr:hypothetical protein TNCV_1856311 [Trichonephila clavipes]
MRLIYRLAEGNARATERLYHERYPQRDGPDYTECLLICNTINGARAIAKNARPSPTEIVPADRRFYEIHRNRTEKNILHIAEDTHLDASVVHRLGQR